MIFTFKGTAVMENKETKEKTEIITVVSMEMDDCRVIHDNGQSVEAYLDSSAGVIVIPQKSREAFIKAWERSKGCRLQPVWEGEDGNSRLSMGFDEEMNKKMEELSKRKPSAEEKASARTIIDIPKSDAFQTPTFKTVLEED